MSVFWRRLAGLAWTAVAAAAMAADAPTTLDKVELLDRPAARVLTGLPKAAPQPILYLAAGALAPSCGLVSSRVPSAVITSMVEPEPGVSFPACLGVIDASTFHVDGASGFVFRYRQRDTREDTSTGYFFVRHAAQSLLPLDELNQQTVPDRKSTRLVAAWARSTLSALADERQGYRARAADSISTETAFLVVSRNPATQHCRTVVDLIDSHAGPEPVTTPCKAVLASTSWVGKGASYLIVLVEGQDGAPQGQVFVVRPDSVRRAADLACGAVKPTLTAPFVGRQRGTDRLGMSESCGHAA